MALIPKIHVILVGLLSIFVRLEVKVEWWLINSCFSLYLVMSPHLVVHVYVLGTTSSATDNWWTSNAKSASFFHSTFVEILDQIFKDLTGKKPNDFSYLTYFVKIFSFILDRLKFYFKVRLCLFSLQRCLSISARIPVV